MELWQEGEGRLFPACLCLSVCVSVRLRLSPRMCVLLSLIPLVHFGSGFLFLRDVSGTTFVPRSSRLFHSRA